ncbi:hypothetical protein ACNAW0_04500 [Micromonospora sp. SL1-18]|uniref:hypothetical protein n=1 Tax=Micromonospora sp. SL1-18 TaxID=3399128 RepID=UPI003A4E2AA4
MVAVDGLPVLDPAWAVAPAALVALPADISALRRDDSAAASAWQHAVGGVLQEALASGWRADWDPSGAYRLTANSPRAMGSGSTSVGVGTGSAESDDVTVPHR